MLRLIFETNLIQVGCSVTPSISLISEKSSQAFSTSNSRLICVTTSCHRTYSMEFRRYLPLQGHCWVYNVQLRFSEWIHSRNDGPKSEATWIPIHCIRKLHIEWLFAASFDGPLSRYNAVIAQSKSRLRPFSCFTKIWRELNTWGYIISQQLLCALHTVHPHAMHYANFQNRAMTSSSFFLWGLSMW